MTLDKILFDLITSAQRLDPITTYVCITRAKKLVDIAFASLPDYKKMGEGLGLKYKPELRAVLFVESLKTKAEETKESQRILKNTEFCFALLKCERDKAAGVFD